MATIGIEVDRPLCPAGPGVFRLKSVETKEMQAYGKAESETEPKLIWNFISNQKAPDGAFYEVSCFTGLRYGNDQARLTWLLDMIHPGINAATIKAQGGLNTDDYVDSVYEGTVKHVTAPNGKVYANFVYLKPFGTPSTPAGFDEQEAALDADLFDSPDPGAVVACEVCQAELTDMEAIACAKRWGDGHRFCMQHGRAFIEEEKRAVRQAEMADDPFVTA